MTKEPSKPHKKALPDAKRFMSKLGLGQAYSLPDVAAALYSTGRIKQIDLLKLLASGELVASVFWPIPSQSHDLPSTYWAQLSPDEFNVRERSTKHGWSEVPHTLHRGVLNRVLILPLLQNILESSSRQQPVTEAPTSVVISRDGLESREDLPIAIAALKSKASAEVFITYTNVHKFAVKYFGSLTRKRGRPPLEREAALIEAFRRIYGVEPRPKQDALVADLVEWHVRLFGAGSTKWMTSEIVSPIWKALSLSRDEA